MIKGRLLQLGFIASITLGFMAPGIAHAEPKVGDTVQLPDITLVDGTVVPASQLHGKPVLIEYWASWCPFCARQNPYWQKLHEAARGKNIEILSVSIDKKPDDAVQYLRKHNYSFHAALETPQLRQVFGKRKVIPQVFVIQPDGKVAEVIPGEMFEEDVLDLIKYAH
jgi:thiol-disulfide isomerase/thioredoxin